LVSFYSISLKPPFLENLIESIKKIIRKDGFLGMYKGLGATIIRETPSYAFYFASYEYLIRSSSDSKPSSLSILTCGGIAGIIGWLSTYPADGKL
jgi:solute carrier family 25 carnitine/acylcarnitine transporter 20/29